MHRYRQRLLSIFRHIFLLLFIPHERMRHMHPIELPPLIFVKFRINHLCYFKLVLFHSFIAFLTAATYIFRLVEDIRRELFVSIFLGMIYLHHPQSVISVGSIHLCRALPEFVIPARCFPFPSSSFHLPVSV